MGEALPVDAETPYEFVRRRRAEGASEEVLKSELVARGHASDEVALLLGGERLSAGVMSPTEPAPTGDTPWEVVKKLRSEGFPPDAIARELEGKGVSRDDIKALLVDESVRPIEPADAGRGLNVQLIFGLLLIIAGGVLLLGGRISLLSIGLLVSGVARTGSSFATERSTTALKAEALRQMAALAADDPRARCAVHQQYASIGSCPRCGSFCCAQCTPTRGFAAGNVCMACQVLPDVRADRQRKASRVGARMLLTAPALLLVMTVLETAFAKAAPSGFVVLVSVGLMSLPWLVLAGVQSRAQGGWPILISVPFWLLIEVAFTRGNSGFEGALWLLPLGAAFFGWVNIRQAAKLEEALVVSSPVP
jgi:hypothetical protein